MSRIRVVQDDADAVMSRQPVVRRCKAPARLKRGKNSRRISISVVA